MKALIISNDDYIVQQSSKALKEIGFDLIVYKWLLKALDNLEEIHPDLILISADEYPRHWKTLVQFLKSGLGGEKTAVYLYEAFSLSEDDEDKAKALGITGEIKSFSDDNIDSFKESVCDFFKLNLESEIKIPVASVSKNKTEVMDDETELITVEDLFTDTNKQSLDNQNEETKFFDSSYVIFNNPETSILNTGKVVSINHNKLECHFDFDFSNLSNNDQISYVSYFDGKEISSFSAEIFVLNYEEKSAILTINEKYEEI